MLTALEGVVAVALAVALALGGFALVHTRVHVSVREAQNDIAGFIYAVVGVIYAVLLAFVVVVVWQQFTDTSDIVDREGNALGNLYQLSERFPDTQRTELRRLLTAYGHTVVTEEWPLLASGQSSRRATELLAQVGSAVDALPVNNLREQVIYADAMNHLHDLDESRDLRLTKTNSSLHVGLWVVVVLGGVVTVGFSYFFGLKNTRSHAAMIGILAGVIASCLFLIWAIDRPFAGDISVRPDAFEQVMATFATER